MRVYTWTRLYYSDNFFFWYGLFASRYLYVQSNQLSLGVLTKSRYSAFGSTACGYSAFSFSASKEKKIIQTLISLVEIGTDRWVLPLPLEERECFFPFDFVLVLASRCSASRTLATSAFPLVFNSRAGRASTHTVVTRAPV